MPWGYDPGQYTMPWGYDPGQYNMPWGYDTPQANIHLTVEYSIIQLNSLQILPKLYSGCY